MDPMIDRAAVLDRVGDDEELLCEIASIFLAEYPCLVDEIRTAVGSRDAKRLERAAHSLKGAVSNFGAQAATDAAYRLERMGRTQEMAQAAEALDELLLQFQRLRPELEALSGQGAIVSSFTL
jgi:HPt (histidine-containing phosphotransfer) domain-containing protein